MEGGGQFVVLSIKVKDVVMEHVVDHLDIYIYIVTLPFEMSLMDTFPKMRPCLVNMFKVFTCSVSRRFA